ncbi:MAG: UDP-4-amino-4,6-dideoxy-N-acetyl-beta-L-altrosamine N-acetyltransferase [Helicobacteraceae bacterium]|jgi:UDP-4-amino-4,6-dideoxy-N-acetyl-beta-L-altrosamine N-acetyltransferase|nr:UDP-4-amino-4,6-dideoxy-N-acetyl-beta-L-altrosamine N-acetyltransferase [Helicobacteraceae bacterium]
MRIEVVNFIDLSSDRLRQVLEWRNQTNVREFSNEKKTILIDEHLAFVERLKRDAQKAYYFVLLQTKNARGGGVFSFNDITNEQALMGLYKDGQSTLKGTGGVLMELALLTARQKGLKRLYLRLLKDNDRAMRLYKRFDFAIVSEDEKMYRMQKDL